MPWRHNDYKRVRDCADIGPQSSGDGIVNGLDFNELAKHWLEGVTP